MEIDSRLFVESIRSAEPLKDFFCGIDSMDNFIHQDFSMSLENHYCKAYVVKDASENILAMFALSFDSIDLDSDDREELQEGLSFAGTPDIEYDYQDTFYSKQRYPALDIAYLAVNKNFRNHGLGSTIIEMIVDKAIQQNLAGCQFLTVEALKTKEYSAVGFYTKCGFAPNELPNPNKDTLRMFKTLRVKSFED